MRNFLESSNPALTGEHNPFAYRDGGYVDTRTRPTGATLQGVVNKTALLVGIAVLAGAGGYVIVDNVAAALGGLMWIVPLAAIIVTFGLYFAITRKPERAKGLAPVYAVVEGAFLGAVTGVLDRMLESMQISVVGGLALQAFVITISIMLAMLALYYTRILQPSRTFVAVLSTLTVGIMIMYGINFLLAIFGISMPFLNINSAFQGGTPALIGLGLNAFILIVASLWLIVDFKLVEDTVNSGASKDMEWYCGFALLVTLAWIYYEAVKLAFRVAILLGNRE